MGLSIHYKGRISDPKKLPELIEEIIDVARLHQWEYHVFNDDLPIDNTTNESQEENLQGICFTPPGCETVFFFFRPDGQMSAPMQLTLEELQKHDISEECLDYISVKTQYAGFEIHKILINLFRHISEKYLTEFTMSDESEY